MHKGRFLAVPKFLFDDARYAKLKIEDKIVYAKLVELDGLSAQNQGRWLDAKGRIFCEYAEEKIGEFVGCEKKKAGKILKRLEAARLITCIKQGQGKPQRIYVHQPQSSDFGKSRDSKKGGLDAPKTAPKETEAHGDRDYPSNQGTDADRKKRREPVTKAEIEECRDKVYLQIAYEYFKKEEPLLIEDIVGVMVDVLISHKTSFTIGGTSYEADVVKERIGRIDPLSIRRLINGLRASRSKKKNPYAYLLKSLMQEDFSDHLSMPPVNKNRED